MIIANTHNIATVIYLLYNSIAIILWLWIPLFSPAGQVQLRFGDRDVRNNSYILRGDIPYAPGGVNGLLCASDATNPATRQWYDRDGDALGTVDPSNGAYQAIDSASGGVLLYTAGTIDTGLHYCRISDSSGNIQTLYAGLYTGSSFEQSGRANGENMCGTPARATQLHFVIMSAMPAYRLVLRN